MVAIYKLSEIGRQVTWGHWRKAGGCGLSNESQWVVGRRLVVRLNNETKLGDIEDVWATAGRELARFAKDHLGRKEWAMPW